MSGRSRSRSRERRRRSRSRERKRSRSRERSPRRSRRSRSGSRERSGGNGEAGERRERRRTRGWDIGPGGAAAPPPDAMAASAAPSGAMMHPARAAMLAGQAPSSVSQPFQAAQVLSALMNPAAAAMMNPANQQIYKKARTAYIGNVQPNLTELDLRMFFNERVAQVRGRPPTPGQPVELVSINHAGMYAFVEFHNATDADISMALDGAVLKGNALRVRRPKDYKAMPNHEVRDWKIDDVIATHVPDGPNKIFLGGLPPELTDDQLRQIVSALGKLSGFTLCRDVFTGQAKGYAFFCYEDTSLTPIAVQTFNNMEIMGKTVACKVAKSGMGGDAQSFLASMSMGPLAITASGSNTLPLGVQQQLLLTAMPHDPLAAAAAAAAGAPAAPPAMPPGPPPTRVLAMQNMVTEQELVDDAEYNDILQDVRQECSNYGTVLSVLMPRPPRFADPRLEAARQDVGQVFVEYAAPDHTARARQAIEGRKFASRVITTAYVSDEEYAAKRALWGQ